MLLEEKRKNDDQILEGPVRCSQGLEGGKVWKDSKEIDPKQMRIM